jgi:hypothetical protein
MYTCEQVLFNPTEYRASDNTKLIVRAGRKTDSDSGIDGEVIQHVGENPLNPRGNCIKHGCNVCTPYDQCIQCDDYHGISKRKRKYKKRKTNENEIISDVEKLLLKQFRQQQKWELQYDDFGPIGGTN